MRKSSANRTRRKVSFTVVLEADSKADKKLKDAQPSKSSEKRQNAKGTTRAIDFSYLQGKKKSEAEADKDGTSYIANCSTHLLEKPKKKKQEESGIIDAESGPSKKQKSGTIF